MKQSSKVRPHTGKDKTKRLDMNAPGASQNNFFQQMSINQIIPGYETLSKD